MRIRFGNDESNPEGVRELTEKDLESFTNEEREFILAQAYGVDIASNEIIF
ncbi:hypothetical protein ACYRFS_12780 [Listeria kieliensis]